MNSGMDVYKNFNEHINLILVATFYPNNFCWNFSI